MKFAKIFIILAVSMAAVAVAQDSSACGAYKVSPPTPTSNEYQLYCGMFHFGSFIVDPNGTLVFRPHPDQHDANGWGTSWFMAPFLAGADPTSGSVNSITGGPEGIQANLSGLVANTGGSTYGNWNINGTLTYNSLAQKVIASGNLNINLNGTLTDAKRDLNLERLSSNYLYNVPRQLNGVGNTGDIKEIIVTYGIQDPHNFVWIPTPSEPATYPTYASTSLEIGLVGQINDVDTLAQGKGFQITIARKPTVNLDFSSMVAPLSAGLAWDPNRGQDFAADNIGLNHLVLKGNSTATQMTFNFTMNSISPYGKDCIIIDFGDPYGIYRYQCGGQNWLQLHPLTAVQPVAAFLDGNSQSDLVVNFGNPYGTWVLIRAWTNQRWVKLHDLSPTSITAANLDSNGQDDLVINFGNPYGIWVWMNNQTWVKLHDLSPVSITAADLDGNAQSDLVVNFGDPYGTWVWMNNQTWWQLHTLAPVSITAADLDGNGQSDLVIDLAPYGIWKWMNNQTWVKLHDLSAHSITAADLDGNGLDDLAINFGDPDGIWRWMNNQTWVKLHDLSPASITAAYLDDNAQQDLVIDFAPYGIWQWLNNQNWVKLHDLPAKHIIASPE